MRFPATRFCLLALGVLVASQAGGCSPEPGVDSVQGSGGSTAGAASPPAGAPTNVAGSSGAPSMGGAGGAPGTLVSGAAGQSTSSSGAGGASGAATGGVAGASGSAGSGGSGGSPGPSPLCQELEAAYASALAEQVTCNSGASNQCGDRAEAAPGCDCHVFIQPKDPFAIEHLLNLQSDWFDADCEGSSCPADCPDSEHGSCAQSGQCVPG